MNAVATIPSAGVGEIFGAGEHLPAKAAADGAASTRLLATLFPALLGGLLEADAQPGPEPDKQEHEKPGAVAPVLISLPAEPARLPLSMPSSDTACLEGAIPNQNQAIAAFVPAVRDTRSALDVAPAPNGDTRAVAAAPAAKSSTPEEPTAFPVDAAALPLGSDTLPAAPPAEASSPIASASEVLQSPSAGPAPVPDKSAAGTEVPPPTANGERSPEPAVPSSAANVIVELPAVDLSTINLPTADRPRRPSPAEISVPAGLRREPRVLPDEAVAPSPAELAFAARLRPVEKEPTPQSGLPLQSKSAPVQAAVRSADTGGATDAAAPRPDSRPPSALAPPPVDRPAADSERARSEPSRSESPLPPLPQAGAALGSTPPAAREVRAAPGAEPHHPAAAPLGEPAEPALAARDIRLQIHGGEQRVDVRLAERGGTVQVAVRTPDSRLAEALRSDLPALSARLEQSGFRAETWHPAALRTENYGVAPEQAPSGFAPQDQGGQRHGRQPDQEPPSHRAPETSGRNPSEAPPPEFSWLFSSLR